MADRAQEKADFYWLTTDGQQLSGSEQELRAALSTGALSAETLVWRRGWAEWQAAQRVVELAASLPTPVERKSAPRSSKPSAAPVQMPPLVPRTPLSAALPPAPVSRSPATSRSDQSGNLPSSPGQHEVARDTLAPSSFGTIGTARQPALPGTRESGTPPPPPVRARAPLPTLTEEVGVASATATLRPPGAVPPPPRGVPTPALDANAFTSEKRGAARTPIPGFGWPGGTLSTLPPSAALPRLGAEPASNPNAALTPALSEPAVAPNTLPPVVNRALLREPAPAALEPSLDSTLEVLQSVPAEAQRTLNEPLPVRGSPASSAADQPAQALDRQRDSLAQIAQVGRGSRTLVILLSAISGALLLAVIGLVITRGQAKAPADDASPSASASARSPVAPAPVPVPANGCRLGLPAARIFANVERGVPPYFGKLPGESWLALGIAASATKGIGLRLSPDTLDVTQSFEEEGKGAVRGVVPLTRSGSLSFFVDRDDRALRSAHTVDEIPPFTLGLSDAGFSRVVAGSPSLIWPLDARLKITEPRSAQLADFGYGVTFRRGGQSGSVLLGFVASDGAKKSELLEIPSAPKLLGTPVIAGSAAGALVAFAGRDSVDAPWQLFVSRSKPGAAPSPARALIAGSGGGAISPTLSALGEGRWLVQWTEGSSGQYQVRVQSFAADLSPIGQAVLVSPKGANAGQGSLSAAASSVTSLFVLTTAEHDELWGATLACQ